MTTGVFHNRKATNSISANVIDMVSDWDDTVDGGRSFDEVYSPENEAIDMAQSANSLPEHCPTSPMGRCSTVLHFVEALDQVQLVARLPHLFISLSCYLMRVFSIWLLLKQICMHSKTLLETDISGMILMLMK